MHEQAFDALVSDIYRAATGELPWDQALDGIQAAFGARTAVLQAADPRTGQLLSLNAGGPTIHDAALDYVRTYHRLCPRRAIALERYPAILGQWVHCHEHLDDATMSAHPFYVDYLAALGSRYLSATVLATPNDSVTFFALELPASRGVLNADERELARRLGEHVREALHAWYRLRELMERALAGHTLLAQFPYPMWLLGQDRRIAYANAPAQREGEKQDRVQHVAQRLSLASARKDIELTTQLHALMQRGHGATAVLDMRQRASDAPIWLHLSVVVPSMALGAFGSQPLVLATLFDPAQVQALDTFALSNLFSLTPAEAKVAARMADGLTAEDIARKHATSVATVRTQVRHVMGKLGARRSAEAVRMLRQGDALWSVADQANAVVH